MLGPGKHVSIKKCMQTVTPFKDGNSIFMWCPDSCSMLIWENGWVKATNYLEISLEKIVVTTPMPVFKREWKQISGMQFVNDVQSGKKVKICSTSGETIIPPGQYVAFFVFE